MLNSQNNPRSDMVSPEFAVGMSREAVLETGKRRRTVCARSLLCYWAADKLRISTTKLSAKLGIPVNCVGQSVARGKILAKMNDYSMTRQLRLKDENVP
jgi:hypothetical protein